MPTRTVTALAPREGCVLVSGLTLSGGASGSSAQEVLASRPNVPFTPRPLDHSLRGRGRGRGLPAPGSAAGVSVVVLVAPPVDSSSSALYASANSLAVTLARSRSVPS